jgi:hypothetical protein
MATWTFQRIQYGYWGTSTLREKSGELKRIRVKADTLEAARLKVIRRKDYTVRLGNGDERTWMFVGDGI